MLYFIQHNGLASGFGENSQLYCLHSFNYLVLSNKKIRVSLSAFTPYFPVSS